jgi:hypothetical protein
MLRAKLSARSPGDSTGLKRQRATGLRIRSTLAAGEWRETHAVATTHHPSNPTSWGRIPSGPRLAGENTDLKTRGT